MKNKILDFQKLIKIKAEYFFTIIFHIDIAIEFWYWLFFYT